MKTLADAFEHTLQYVYYAENAITKAFKSDRCGEQRATSKWR